MRFIVDGNPFGKMRPRARHFGGVYNPKQNKEYEERVRKAYIKAVGLIEEPTLLPMWMNVELIFPIPKTTPKKRREAMIDGKIYPLTKPDMDNCLKSIMDALNGVAYKDDKQVVLIRCSKKYGERPQSIIDIGRYYA